MKRTKKQIYENLLKYRVKVAGLVKQKARHEVELRREIDHLKEVVDTQSKNRLKMVEENDLLRKLLAMYMPEIHQYRRW